MSSQASRSAHIREASYAKDVPWSRVLLVLWRLGETPHHILRCIDCLHKRTLEWGQMMVECVDDRCRPPGGEKPLGLFLPNFTSTSDGNHFARLGRF